MYDRPTPAELTEACDRFDASLGPDPTPAQRYEARVAANARALVQRQAAQEAEADAAELDRLRMLIGDDGDLATLNRRLAQAIADRVLTLESPGVVEHLWATILAKVAVDQPSYAAYRAETGNP